MARPGISIDWFFEEAWRADMVRSSFGFERYFAHNTPTAPGWVFVHQFLFNVLPPTRQLLRLVAVLPAIPAWVLIGNILRTKLVGRIGAVGAVVSLAVTYLFFLRPVANREIPGLATITGYWEGETFQAAGLIGVAKLVIRTMMFAVLPQRLEWTLIGWLLISIGGIIGVTVMWSCFRFWVIAIPLTQLQILVASIVVGWPISFTRVNHAVGLLVTVLVAFGISMLMWWFASRVPKGSVALAALLTCVALALMWPSGLRQAAGGTGVFARGLSDDMDLLAPQISEGDVVLGYHSMSSWYLHDRLVTESDVPIVLIDELEHDVVLRREPERLIDEFCREAGLVWCVLPWELGDVLDERCQLSDDWSLQRVEVMDRAEVRQWVRAETPG